MALDAGGIFGVIYLSWFTPVSVAALAFFYLRRDIQPIKARSPILVVVTDIILILFILTLCLQRIFVRDYPCFVNTWSGWIGTIVLCNTYLARCWTLYFNYYFTQLKLSMKDEGLKDDTNFFLKYRRYVSISFLTKALGTIAVLLLIPVAVLTATRDTIVHDTGDNCKKGWGDIVLAAYVVVYVLLFCWFAWNLREVVDAFKIKEELKFTGIVGAVVVIPWYLFNNVWNDINTDTFPFSTLSLIIAATAAFLASTGWPLYRTIRHPPALEHLHVPENVATLKGLLADPDGAASFKTFLSQEFSVENILFYQEVEAFKRKRQESVSEMELLGIAQNLYAKYIIRGAPFEVNLPSRIVNQLQRRLKDEYGLISKQQVTSKTMNDVSESEDRMLDSKVDEEDSRVGIDTIFDDAAANIFNLMETDSYQRYIATPAYAELSEQFKERNRKKGVLLEMGVI